MITVEDLKKAGRFIVTERIKEVEKPGQVMMTIGQNYLKVDPIEFTRPSTYGLSYLFEYMKDGQLTISRNDSPPVPLDKVEKTLECLVEATDWESADHRFFTEIFLKDSISFMIYYPLIRLSPA